MKIQFIAERRDPEFHRNFNYTVVKDQTYMGTLEAMFTGNNHSRLWVLNPLHMQELCRICPDKAADLNLPLRHLKAMIRNLVSEPRNLALLTLTELEAFAAQCHLEWIAMSRKEQDQHRIQVRFGTRQRNDKNPHIFRRYPKIEYYVQRQDNTGVGVIRDNVWTESANPSWKFCGYLSQKLGVQPGFFWNMTSLPFYHSKALVRHCLKNSIWLDGKNNIDICQIAQFALDQERAAKRSHHET